ncbi:hypothetical protein EOE18_13180 [Novosphingobium umbonatum]|uniref:Uncharacterized protein n=1 Tax=Novosphingobium umbonatum TaxID=1908524 RepID=A0A3S2VRY2_9SPHN|nr:hypothetical protein [Novosphingobium umbonatum]RVU04118.1 hypothetical protein EOE18_13180 [Novosphingobium umbonatum]
MPDNQMVTPEAAELLTLMLEETRLPDNWEVSEFWLAHAQMLAQFMADYRAKIAFGDAAMLLGLGGMLVAQAQREREACAAAGTFLRSDGGNAHD